MDATGPTGPSESVDPMSFTGPTGPIENTGPIEGINPMGFTGPTGPVIQVSEPFQTGPPPMLIDIAELLASHGGIKQQEITDRITLSVLLNPSRDSIRASMFQWAEAGFPPIYIIQELTVTPPAVCSDGVSRSLYDYITFLLGQDMGAINASIQALCIGVTISYSFQGNRVRIHVSRS